MGLKGWIIPQERQFFDLLEKLAGTVDEGAIALADLLHDFRDVPMKCRRIKDVEHHGDEIVHRVYEELNKTFITPIDREDIQSLATELDNVLDMVEAASSRIGLYEIDRPTEAMVQLGNVIKDGTRLLREAVGMIRNMKQADGVERIAIEVHRLENVADDLMNNAVAKLFHEEDPVTIIKFKEITEVLEQATDHCEDLPDLLDLVDRYGILLMEELRDRVVHEVVGDVLEAVDLDGDPLDPIRLLHVANHPDGLPQEPRSVFDHISELHHRLGRTINFVEADPARGRLDHVEDIVELGGEGLDVLPVDRRDERLVQFLVNPMDDLVAVVLHVLDPSALHRHVAELVQQVRQGDRTLVDRGGELLEKIEKLALLRDNPCFQTHWPSLPDNAVVLGHH